MRRLKLQMEWALFQTIEINLILAVALQISELGAIFHMFNFK